MSVSVKDDDYCILCGKENPIGLKLEFSTDKTNLASKCITKIPKEYQGWRDIVHGGIISSLLDEACAYACFNISLEFVTAEINVRFKKPLKINEEITISGKIVSNKGRIYQVEGEVIRNSDNLLIAEANAKFFKVK